MGVLFETLRRLAEQQRPPEDYRFVVHVKSTDDPSIEGANVVGDDEPSDLANCPRREVATTTERVTGIGETPQHIPLDPDPAPTDRPPAPPRRSVLLIRGADGELVPLGHWRTHTHEDAWD